jgi:hypothetical protein
MASGKQKGSLACEWREIARPAAPEGKLRSRRNNNIERGMLARTGGSRRRIASTLS